MSISLSIVKQKKLDLIFSHLMKVNMALLMIGALVFLALLGYIPLKTLAIWYGLNIGVVVFRVVLIRMYNKDPKGERYIPLLLLGNVFSASVWSFGILSFFPDDVILQTFILFTVGGLAAGSTASSSALFKPFLAYIIILLCPYIVHFTFVSEHSLHFHMSVALGVYMIILMFIGQNIHESSHQLILANAENQELIEEMKIKTKAAEEAALVKSEFLANMSHEIRTPMNSIIGMTDLALDSSLNDKERNYIQKANLAAKNLLGIINDILDFSKMEAGKMEFFLTHFELKEVINHTLQLIKLVAQEKHISLRVKLDKDVPKYYFADPLRLEQVLINLANNAVKFSPEGSNITLSASLSQEDEENAWIEFCVEDEGIGISGKDQQKLFQSFTQADNSTQRKFGGTGLGLVISQKIVEMMDGKIWVESEEGEGSRFSFVVRMNKSSIDELVEVTKDSKTTMQLDIQKLRGIKVLLVEDNEMNQELAADLLERNGLQVKIANHGAEGVQMLKREDFDIVLMDIQMPVMDGYEATKHIRVDEAYKDVPIIAMSANVMHEDIEKAYASGMNDHIGKPINPEDMFRTMAKWYGQTKG